MNKVLHGDCLELMKDIPSGSIDAIITDPPYGTTACKWDSVIPFDLMWEQLNRIIKPNGAIVLFGSQPFTSTLIVSNLKMYRHQWIWKKSRPANFMNANYQPMKYHEDVLVFGLNKVNYYPIKFKGNKNHASTARSGSSNIYGLYENKAGVDTNDMKYPSSIIEIKSTDSTKNLHPTQKPVALMEYLIKTYTNENETVLDFTMGSGTTGVACVNLNRNFIGIEKDDKYFEIAKKRITDWHTEKEQRLF